MANYIILTNSKEQNDKSKRITRGNKSSNDFKPRNAILSKTNENTNNANNDIHEKQTDVATLLAKISVFNFIPILTSLVSDSKIPLRNNTASSRKVRIGKYETYTLKSITGNEVKNLQYNGEKKWKVVNKSSEYGDEFRTRITMVVPTLEELSERYPGWFSFRVYFRHIWWFVQDEASHQPTGNMLLQLNKNRLMQGLWMVTSEVFTEVIGTTDTVERLKYSFIFPSDCRMFVLLPGLDGGYINYKDVLSNNTAYLSYDPTMLL